MKRFALAALAAMSIGASPARAADDIVIGVIYPFSGAAAPLGAEAKFAYDAAAEIVNGKHLPIPVTMGQGGGFSGLGGARIKLIFGDSRGDPKFAASEAERLINLERATVLLGSYSSATSAAISGVAEKLQRPYVNADATAPGLTAPGLKWSFRTSPNDQMFSEAMFQFFAEEGKKTGHPVTSVALFYEDSVFGNGSADAERKLAAANGIKVVADIKYKPGTSSFAAEAAALKAANADVFMPSAYANEAVAILKAMDAVGYHPHAIMAQAAGAHEAAYVTGAGKLAEGTLSRSAFALDAINVRPAIPAVNAMYKIRSGVDLNDNTAREITALLTVAGAIDDAGSADPEAIRKALVETDIPGGETVVPWPGVKFDQTGQNVMAVPVIEQLIGGQYRTVWPFLIAVKPVTWGVGK